MKRTIGMMTRGKSLTSIRARPARTGRELQKLQTPRRDCAPPAAGRLRMASLQVLRNASHEMDAL